MKNLLLIAAFVLVSFSLIAQEAKTNMLIDDKNVEISIKKVTDGYKYSFKQEGNTENLPEFNSTMLNRETFFAFTKTAFKEINQEISNKEELTIQEKIDMTFIELVAMLFNEDADGPKIATLKLKEKIPLYTTSDTNYLYNLVPRNCYVVFKDGFIEQIKIYGKVEIDLDNAIIAAKAKQHAAFLKVKSAQKKFSYTDSLQKSAQKEVNEADTKLKNIKVKDPTDEDKKKVDDAQEDLLKARNKLDSANMKFKYANEELKDANEEYENAKKVINILEIIKTNIPLLANAKNELTKAQDTVKATQIKLNEIVAKRKATEVSLALAYRLVDSVKVLLADAIIARDNKMKNAIGLFTDANRAQDEANKQLDFANKEFLKAETDFNNENDKLKCAERKLNKAEQQVKEIEEILIAAKKELIFQEQGGKEKFKIKDGEEYGFTNIYSIGISSLTNRKNLSNITIYIDNSKKRKAARINLGEAINYNSIPEVGTRDYSPANGKVELMKGQTIDLHKPTNEKLLEFKVFTDAVGFGEDTPNGLVQLELEKRVPINTTSWQFICMRAGWSYLSFIDLEFTYSKIENKVKYLDLDADTYSYFPVNDTITQDTTAYYLNALQVFRHQIFQVGMKLNLFLLESQPNKFDFEINLHANFGYARVIDTILIDDESVNIDAPINTFMFAPEVKFIFYPEKRLNFSISDKVTRQYFLYSTDKFDYTSTMENELVQGSKWFNTVSIDAYYWPSDQGKIFVRYSFNHELNNVDSNFNQFQIGYSMNLKTSKKD